MAGVRVSKKLSSPQSLKLNEELTQLTHKPKGDCGLGVLQTQLTYYSRHGF